MRRRVALFAFACLLFAGCGKSSESPPFDAEKGKFEPGTTAVLYGNSSNDDTVLAWMSGPKTEVYLAPVFLRVVVVDDPGGKPERDVRVRFDEGENVTKIGRIARGNLRPARK